MYHLLIMIASLTSCSQYHKAKSDRKRGHAYNIVMSMLQARRDRGHGRCNRRTTIPTQHRAVSCVQLEPKPDGTGHKLVVTIAVVP